MRVPETQRDSVVKLSQSNGSNFFASGLRQKVDQLMNILWAGGVNNPMDSIEQLSYLIFLRLLSERDEQAALIEKGYQRIFSNSWARYAWGVWWSPWDMRLNTTLMLWLLYMSYLILRRSSTAGSTSVLASALAIFAFLDVPIVYMANRWFRTHHPSPLIGTPNLDPRMQNILFINMLAFLCFGTLIAWFRYEMERTAQKINTAHVQRAAGGAAGMMLLPAMFFATPGHVNPHAYLWGGYMAAWGIYLAYLLFLMSKLARLKKEAAELHT